PPRAPQSSGSGGHRVARWRSTFARLGPASAWCPPDRTCVVLRRPMASRHRVTEGRRAARGRRPQNRRGCGSRMSCRGRRTVAARAPLYDRGRRSCLPDRWGRHALRASRESHAGSGGPPEKEGDREVAPQVAGHGYRYEGETSNKRDQRYHLFERWLGSYPQGPIARPQDEKVQGDIEGAAQQSHVAEHSKHRALAGADQAAIADSRSARAEPEGVFEVELQIVDQVGVVLGGGAVVTGDGPDEAGQMNELQVSVHRGGDRR